MDLYKGEIPIIDDTPAGRSLAFPGKDEEGNKIGFGYVPRDYAVDPPEMFAAPTDIKLYEESDLDAIWQEQEETKSSLEHIFLRGGQPAFINLDQNGHGYCWAYSNGSAQMIARMRDNLPNPRLNPHSVAAIIKNGRDEGGWCGLSAKFVRDKGMAEEGTGPGQWPLHSRSLSNNTAAVQEAMKRNVVTEEYVDLTRDVYSQNLTEKQLWSVLIGRNPCQVDFNWWGHSVCAIRWVRIEAGSYGLLILNSWKGWGRFGLGVLRGSQRRPDGAICVRQSTINVPKAA